MLIWLAKMSVAWLLAIAGMTALGGLTGGRRPSMPDRDGMLGIGLAVGLPMLLFALLVALPLSLLVARTMAPLAGALFYPPLLAGAAGLTGLAAVPRGWKGARRAMVLFAFLMGAGWSVLSLLPLPGPA